MVGGIERYVLDLSTAQARHGLPTTVITLRRDVLGVHAGPLSAADSIDGVRVRRLAGIGNQRFGLCLRPDQLAREIRRSDVVHLHDLRFMLGFSCLVARATRRPLVFHTHGLLAHTAFASRVKRWMMRWYYGPMLRLGRAQVVASSEHDGEMLLADVPSLAKDTRALLNAVDLGTYRDIRRRPVPRRLLVFGRVAERKGIDRVIAALAHVDDPAGVEPWTLVIAGTEEVSERTRLDRSIEQAGLGSRVTFMGEYSDAEQIQLLEGASLAIFGSRAEGFGLALLEAMAAGVPVLASDIPPHRALLGSTLGELLVDFDDAAAASGAIDRLLRLTPAEQATLSTRERAAAAPFDIERLRSEIEDLYRHMGVRRATPTLA